MAFGTYKLSKKPIFISLVFIFFMSLGSVFAQITYYSQGTGNFSTLSNWNTVPGGGGSSPSDLITGDDFVVQNTHTITLDSSTPAIRGLAIQSGGTFDNSSNTLTFGAAPGLFDVQSGGTYTESTGTIQHNAGLLNTVTIQVAADEVFNNISTNGRLTFTGIGATRDFQINGTLTFSSNEAFTLTSSTISYGSSATLNFNATRTISGEWPVSPASVPNVSLQSGAVTIPGATTLIVGTKLTRVNGTITATGTLQYSADGELEYAPSPAGNVTIGDEWQTTSGPDNVTITNALSSVTGSQNYDVSDTFTLNVGTFSLGSNTLTVLGDVVGSDVSGSGTINDNTTLLLGNGSGSNETQTISGVLTLNKLTIDKSAGNSVIVQMTGSSALDFTTGSALTITAGTLDLNGAARFTTAPVTLTLNSGTLNTGGTPLSGVTTLSVASGTVDFDGSTAENIPAATYGNLTVNNTNVAGATAVGALTFGATSTLSVAGTGRLNLNAQTITNAGGSDVLSVASGASLYTDGTSLAGFNTNTWSGTIRFNGSSQETTPNTAISANNVVLNNSAGLVIGTGGLTVTGTLTFSNGKITSATGALLTLAEAATATASATSFATGPVVREADGTATAFVFPIGNGNNLRSVTLNFTTQPSGGSETITAEANGTITSPTSSDPDITSVEDDGSWTITTTTTTNNNSYSGTFTTNGFSPAVTAISSLTMVKGTSPAFNTEGTSPSTGTDFVTASFSDGFSDFAVGNLSAVFTWDDGGGTSNWSQANNWNPNTVPGDGDVIIINGAFTVDYNNSVSTTSYTSITLSGGATLNLEAANIDLSATPIIVGSGDVLLFDGTTLDAYSSASTSYNAGSLVQFSSGSVQADDYADLTISGATGGSGTANVSGDIIISSGSFGGTIALNGSASQDISGASVTFSGLTFDNAAGFTVSSATTVNGTLTLTDGIVENSSNLITLGSGGSISGGSASSFVSGPFAIVGATGVKSFPIGDGVYRPVGTNLTGSTPTVRFEAFDSPPNYSFSGGLLKISTVRYFRGQVTAGSITGGNVTLSYGSDDGVSEFNEAGDVVVARSSDNSSNPYSSLGGQTSGSAPNGSVTSTVAIGTTLDYMTLGTTTGDNSLPVELSTFESIAELDKVTFKWATASETENYGFNIYKKAASEEWSLVNEDIIAGQGNTSVETAYEFVDYAIQSGEIYSYKLESVSLSGVINVEKTIEIAIPIPEKFVLFNNYPNPFNPTTSLKFQLPEFSKVNLTIYDITGRVVKTLLNGSTYDIGQHEVSWDATNQNGTKVSSGMYVYHFSAGKYSKLGRMILVK